MFLIVFYFEMSSENFGENVLLLTIQAFCCISHATIADQKVGIFSKVRSEADHSGIHANNIRFDESKKLYEFFSNWPLIALFHHHQHKFQKINIHSFCMEKIAATNFEQKVADAAAANKTAHFWAKMLITRRFKTGEFFWKIKVCFKNAVFV